MMKIDDKRCTQCGNCAKVCLCGVITVSEERVFFDLSKEEFCIKCGHCRAMCKAKAITIDHNGEYEECCECSSEDILLSLRSKRSVRNYINKPIEKELIQCGIRFAQYAPSSANQHPANWVIVYGRDKTDHIFHLILSYCKRNGKFPMIEALYKTGKNIATVNAPCMIFTYAKKNMFQPAVDCTLAMAAADLFWYKHGLGSCWLGFAMEAGNHDSVLREYLGIPEGCPVYGAMALGYPDEPPYSFLPQRKAPEISWI